MGDEKKDYIAFFNKFEPYKKKTEDKAPLSQIKVLPFKEKNEWNLSAKYNIGKKLPEGTDTQ